MLLNDSLGRAYEIYLSTLSINDSMTLALSSPPVSDSICEFVFDSTLNQAS